MTRRTFIFGLALAATLAAAAPAVCAPQAGRVVDRIVARIEGEVLTLSEVRELGRFQQLVQGQSEPEEKLLDRLIDHWLIEREATAGRFPRPGEEEVDREIARLAAEAGGEEAFRARLQTLGLEPAAVRRLIEAQMYLARYLDYRFRPAAQVEPEQIETYYREQLAPQLRQRGETVPPLESVAERIRELLTQQEIDRRADRWLADARALLRVEKIPPGGRR